MKMYISNQGMCYCEKHVKHAGVYLNAEINKPNQTVSSRATIDGNEYIVTPLDNWIVFDSEEVDDVECEVCMVKTS